MRVQRQADLRVPERLRDRPRIHALREEERCGRVPQVVEAHGRQFGGLPARGTRAWETLSAPSSSVRTPSATRSLHQQWSGATCTPAEGCWQRIAGFQVNLPGKRGDKGWGEIDLLGVAADGLPIVIELKHGSSKEPPPALLAQAAAYAIALQKAWGILRGEWGETVWSQTVLPTALHPARIVCAAPSS